MPRLHCPKCHEINEIAEGAPKACDFCGFGHPGGVPPAPVEASDADADEGPTFDPSYDPNEGKMPWDDDYDHEYEAYRQQMLADDAPAAPDAPAVHDSVYPVPTPSTSYSPEPRAPEVLIAAPGPDARPPKHVQVAGAHLTIEGARLRWSSRGTQANVDIHHIDAVQTAPLVQPDMRALGIAFAVLGLGGLALSYRLFGAMLTNTALVGVAALLAGLVLLGASRRRMFCVHAGDVILRTRVGKVGALQASEAADEIMAVKRRLLAAVVHAPPEGDEPEDEDGDVEPTNSEENEPAADEEPPAPDGPDAADVLEADEDPKEHGEERPGNGSSADDVLERLAN